MIWQNICLMMKGFGILVEKKKWVESPLFWALLEALSGLILAFFLALVPWISINGAIGIVVAYFAFIISANTMVFSHLRKTNEEEFVNRIEEKTIQRYQDICSSLEHLDEISSAESKIDKGLQEYAQSRIKKLIKDLNIMIEGKVSLSTSEYYDEICESMDEMLPGDEVFAISCIDEARWSDENNVPDQRQIRYWEKNKKALHQDVIIRRIFILTNHRTSEDKKNILQKQIDNDVKVYSAKDPKQLNDKFKRDLVIFHGKNKLIAYEDFTDIQDVNRVTHGMKFFDENEIMRFIKLWKLLKEDSERLCKYR